MIGTKICTSPQPSNSYRFVCNNSRAHKCWYSVCVPMTLKQAVHGQGGMTDHLQSMVQEARRVVADVTALLGNRAEACCALRSGKVLSRAQQNRISV